MGRIAHFSATFAGSESGDSWTVLNAGSERGFTVDSVLISFEPKQMTGIDNNLATLSIARYTGVASGGTAGTVFNHTDGDSAGAAVQLSPTTYGASTVDGPVYFPEVVGWADSASAYYTTGGLYVADFSGKNIYIAAGNSISFHTTYVAQAIVFFHENLTP